MTADQHLTRRLAAILAADVVGYTRLMGEDETGTLLHLNLVWAEIFNPTVARYRGRIVKSMGDGALVEFGSAVDAVVGEKVNAERLTLPFEMHCAVIVDPEGPAAAY